MTFTELRYIIAVSKEKHFGRAARSCNVSQPTLSIAIKKLEEELGVSLFDRSLNEIIVTDVGERIIEQAQLIIDEVDNLINIANLQKNELDGTFRLGLIFTVAPYLLPKLIVSLHKNAPNMPLILEENYTHVIETIPLYDELFFVIVPKGHRFEEYDCISSKQLVKEKVLLLTEGNCMRDNILSNCRELAVQQTKLMGIANVLQGSSINTIRHMVASGLGISILPASALDENDHLLFSIIPFKPPIPSRRIVLAYRRHFIRIKAVEAIRQAVLASQLRGVQFIRDYEKDAD